MTRLIFIQILLIIFGSMCPDVLAQSYPTGSDDPDIVAVIPDRFPEISVMFTQSDDFWGLPEKDAFELEENGEKGLITSVTAGMPDHPLNVVIVLDHAGEMSYDGLDFARQAALDFVNTLRVGTDSVMLVTFSSGVDNHTDLTDLNYNKHVLDIILSGVEPDGQRMTYDALQQSLEALGPHKGRKVLLLISSGEDTGSSTPVSTVSGSAQLMRIPIFTIQPHSTRSEKLEKLTQDSGGRMIYVDSPGELSEKLMDLGDELQKVIQLQYRSPDLSQQIKRSLSIHWQHESEKLSMRSAYRRPATTMALPSDNKNISTEPFLTTSGRSPILRILGMVLAVLISLGLVIAFIRWRSGGGDSRQIVPAITYIDQEIRKGKINVKFNVPIRNKPARITLITQQGRPVKDFVFSGKKKQARLDVSDVPDGIYICTLTNAGMISEQAEMVVST